MTCIIWHLYITGAFLPKWIEWKDESYAYGQNIDIELKNHKVEVSKKSEADGKEAEVIWQSDKGVIVQDCLIADVDRNERDELVLLTFRRARYGPHKPFFVDKNDKSWSQHIDVYTYDDERGNFKPIWMASDIGIDAKRFRYDNAHNRLIIQDKNDRVSSWIWPGFGFARAEDSVSFAVCGDNLIHENIYEYGLSKEKGDFTFLYENISDHIKESDVRVLNLETILVDAPELYGGYPSFGTPIQVGEAAAAAGFNVFTCATNHALDKGMTGIDVTKAFCDENEITCLGIQSLDEKEDVPYKILWKKGYSVALFNYTAGLSNTNGKYPEGIPVTAVHMLEDEDRIREDILEARERADAVIVFLHWGTEDTTTIDDQQKKWAEVFNDCGVDVIVGTHPHVIQKYEVLTNDNGQETLIYYSLGNLISAQRREENLTGGVARFTLGITFDGMEVKEYLLEKTKTLKKDGKYTVQFIDEK